MRRLIINADDFGLTPGVNRGIERALREGVVTSATLMAHAHAVDDAAERAQRHGFAVGCHVMLVDGVPVAPFEQVPSLFARGGREMRRGFGSLALAALSGRLRPGDVELEAELQMRKLQVAGLTLTHFDTHKHTHMIPQVLRPLLRAARECGIAAVRNPFAPVRPLALAHLLRRPKLWTRYTEVSLLRRWSESFKRTVTGHGMKTTDGTFGIVVTGALDERLFEAIAGSLPEGTWEFVCHPGEVDDDLRRVRTRLVESRAQELAVLTSSHARDVLQRHGVELISYREL